MLQEFAVLFGTFRVGLLQQLMLLFWGSGMQRWCGYCPTCIEKLQALHIPRHPIGQPSVCSARQSSNSALCHASVKVCVMILAAGWAVQWGHQAGTQGQELQARCSGSVIECHCLPTPVGRGCLCNFQIMLARACHSVLYGDPTQRGQGMMLHHAFDGMGTTGMQGVVCPTVASRGHQNSNSMLL